MGLCKFFGWSLSELRELSLVDYNVAVGYFKDYIRQQKKNSRRK